MDNLQPRKVPFDVAAYARRTQEGPCFVCGIVTGQQDYPHHEIYEDATTTAFLVRYPTLLGHCLVAPKQHSRTGYLSWGEQQFIAFQRTVHRVARALAASVPTERMYSLSLGSQQGNTHLHWHLAPLPPRVPYEKQQLRALSAEDGVLNVDDASQATLARTIASHL